MRVPARLPLHVEALHGLVAPEKVFEGAGQDVMGARLAVGSGRPFVEDETRPALAQRQAGLEGAVSLPGLHHLDLEVREADLAAYFFEHLRVIKKARPAGGRACVRDLDSTVRTAPRS